MPFTTNFAHLHYATLDSTHLWCKRERKQLEYLLHEHHYVLISAYHQLQGQGRHARAWLSCPGNVSCNVVFIDPIVSFPRIQSSNQALAQTSICLLSLACARALQQNVQILGIDAKIKWPNDLVTKEGKLAGLLIEKWQGDQLPLLCVGFGLNIFKPDQDIDQPIDYLTRTIAPPPYLTFIQTVAKDIVDNCHSVYRGSFDSSSCLQDSTFQPGQRVSVQLQKLEYEKPLIARIVSFDDQGRLHLIDESGKLMSLTSGECSCLRALDE